jgi:DNA-binding response OmpR family regulator
VTRNFIVLEKDDDLRSLYRRKLEQKFKGCVVLEAASCSEALESMDRGVVDAIVVNQAAMDARGADMLRAIRRGDAVIPVVSIGDAPQEEISLQCGADIFINTDNWEKIGVAVEEVLSRRPTL